MESLQDALKYMGGVEEAKEECEISPEQLQKESMESSDRAESANEKGLRAQLEEFILGSCGSVVEGLGCRWNDNNFNNTTTQPIQKTEEARPALSIADELKKLAAQEVPVLRPRAQDIPKFLGEDAVYSFEDDNVSAISQHTLEEMARKGIVHPMCQSNGSNGSNRSPSPGRTQSSTSSSKENDDVQL